MRKTKSEDLLRCIQVHCLGAVRCTKAAIRFLKRSSKPIIVNISSRGGSEYVFSASYGVCKAGVDRMAKDFAVELEPYSVAALSLRPSAVTTEFILDSVAKGDIQLDPNRAQSPRFSGRCVAALAMDPDILEKSGGVFDVAALAEEYRFTDPDKE